MQQFISHTAPLIAGASLAVALACSDGIVEPPRERPVIDAVAIAENPHNVLSAVVSISARRADSAAVRYERLDAESPLVRTTPAFPVRDGTVTIPVLGLAPRERYAVRVLVYGNEEVVTGDATELLTGGLPADLPRYVAGGSDPSPGFVLLAAGNYVMVIDNAGQMVWYRRFPDGVGLNFMAQPTGHYVVHPPTADPSDIEPWLVLDALGNITRTLTCAGGLSSRMHDLLLLDDGSAWILCDETRTMDLGAVGGVDGARVTGTVVQHVAANGTLLFEWSPFDHFEITDVDIAQRQGADVNWTHGNAIDLDADGNPIVSFRNLNEITKLDRATGAVLWRLGGLRNQFTFEGTTAPPFAQQHSARSLAPDELLLLDNVGDPLESRVERYELDEVSRTARLVHSYGSVPRVVTRIGGSVQPLPNGRTLVSFGTTGRVEEYDAAGQVVWRIEGEPGYVFRAQRFTSLYAPGVGASR